MQDGSDKNSEGSGTAFEGCLARPVCLPNSDKSMRFGQVSDGNDNDDNMCGANLDRLWPLPVSPVSPLPAASSSSSSIVPQMKVTMSFMKAYKAMRGPRDKEPSPLFACLTKMHGRDTDSSGEQAEDDLFKLAGRDEIKLLNDVNDAIIGDCDENNGSQNTRPFARDGDEHAGRKTVFYFEQPLIQPIFFPGTRPLPKDADGEDNDGAGGDDGSIADYTLDHDKMDQGWIKANGPFGSDGKKRVSSARSAARQQALTDALDGEPYVSDDDGDPAEARISPAVFRALAAGCTLDDVDDLARTVAEAPSLRPLTPQDKILPTSMDTTHRNNVDPHGHRRQFDMYTGEELSPVYRVEPGPTSSVLWSPPGVTPERAGLFLLLLQEGQGEQQQPVRGSGVPTLFRRMAPLDLQELRSRLYGVICEEAAHSMSATLSSSTTSSSSPSDFSSSLPGSNPDSSDGNKNENRSTMTYTWAEVNDAVHHCRFDPATALLTTAGTKNSVQPQFAAHSAGPGQSATATGMATEHALLLMFRDSWHAIQVGEAADARIVDCNEQAQAAITAQAQCLATVEHQLAACRAAERARERREVEAHYLQQRQAERLAEHQARKLRRRRERIVRSINEHLRNLRTTVSEMQARLQQGRELQAVLTQRLRDGEARLARLCREHGVADVEALSEVLADRLARLGAEGDA